jgi:nitrite reductase/ring-hydroxylating ferredoxin subunit
MKRYLLLLFLLPFIQSCSNDGYSNNNRYLPNYNFSEVIDMSLPTFAQLQFPGNAVYVSRAGMGINGVIVMNTGNTYVAYEASCPNQDLGSCSLLQIDGVNAICPCDNVAYSLYTGQPNVPKEFTLKPYRVEQAGQSSLRISN